MDQSQKFWDKTAQKYSKSKVKDMEGYERTLEATRTFLKREATVLEVGCGTGTTALKLAGSVDAMTATDISANMIAIAKEKADKQNIHNVTFLQSTLCDEQLKKESFDVIMAFNLIHLLEDVDQALKRVKELLKPGGLFISKTACLRENSRMLPLIASTMCKILGIPYIHSFTVEELKSFMAKEGFELLESEVYAGKPPRLFAVVRK